ncbi:MAG: hydrogenase formation protein HypD [Clostridia bacterium]|nr:hydrogenase formation protein HypD [Clostridia bacterium]
MRAAEIIEAIHKKAKGLGNIAIMEVCGTHTNELHRHAIPQALPDNIRLVSGPGCPVCVTAQSDIHAALSIAGMKDTVLCCYGDMLRVPCGDTSLLGMKSDGADVRSVVSALEALEIARENPLKQVVFFAVGFETTTPHTAVLIEDAARENVGNLSVLCSHKTMPAAVTALLSGKSGIDALMCPGHVACITGRKGFDFVPEKLKIPAAIAGFEACDMLFALLKICDMLEKSQLECFNAYTRAVSENGNDPALRLTYKIFEESECEWRGLGRITESGLVIRDEYSFFDARRRFEIPDFTEKNARMCICSKILRGEALPSDCPSFASVCTPETPLGACMVSSEGSCAAYYKYER